MPKILLLVPPNKKDMVRDTYYGCWHEKKFLDYSWPPLTLYYLEGLLKDKHEVLVLDGSISSKEETARRIADFDPDLVFFGTGTFTFKEDIEFIWSLGLKARTVAFGQHATICPEEVMKEADFVIRGEPEAVAARIADSYGDEARMRSIPGVCFGSHISPDKAFVEDLDSIPSPNLRKEDSKNYKNPFALRVPSTTIITTRGCPHECIFCTVPSLYGRSFRKRSLANVMGELKSLKQQGFKEVFFRDENLTLDRDFITGLCEGVITEKIKLSWMCNSRIDTLDEDLLELMKKAGCHLIKFGVESGNQDILNKIKKGTKIKNIEWVFDYCNRIGIDTVAHFMIGHPGDTEKTIQETIDFSRRLNPLYASFDVLLHYPGTGLCSTEEISLDDASLKSLHDKAFREFYMRPRLILRHLLNVRTMHEFSSKFSSTVQLWRAFLK